MPSLERDASRDSDRLLKHQHSTSSDGGRAIVPMWDSSDPDRAPPPLPMNPSSPSVAASRPNTSIAIQSAHAALTEKARESGYITNPSPKRIEQSPERSLIKGAAHKRMQSLQTGNVRDLSSFLEGGRSLNAPKSPEKSAGRPGTPDFGRDYFSPEGRSPEKDSRFLLEGSSPEKENEKDKDFNRCTTPTPAPRGEIAIRDTPKLRPSLRKPPHSILGENAPPQSATMLALQNMAGRDTDTALSNVTNGSTALVRTPQTFDAISNQILSLTSIATSLQREMAQLSRRSKDNATDLVSLKEATNARDEDIRKSLRELVTNLNETGSRTSSNIYDSRNLYLDNKAHNHSPSSRNMKAFVLPRIPSPSSFAASLDRDSMASPASFAPDTVTSIALLEKVLREMGTKEGQELLVARLTEVSERLARDGNSTAKKLDDLLKLIKENNSQAVVLQNGGGAGSTKPRNFSFGEGSRLELDFDNPRSGPMTQRVGALLAAGNKENAGLQGGARTSEVFNEEIMKIIRTIKDSVAQGGGLTAEVKALVRELRGEVLGMGREMGRKLDETNTESAKGAATDKERIARIVQEGLEELKMHTDQLLREHRRQSAASMASIPKIDYQEIYNATRSAVNEQNKSRAPPLEKADILEAVKDAWENYKPEIEVQQFGLERDELLTCLREGIQEFTPKDTGATREEVFAAVIEGLKHFSPPQIEPETALSRDEILDAVRECLEEFEFPAAPAPEPIESGITREDMLDAVKEGLHTFDFPINSPTRDVDVGLTRDDMLHAVQEGLKTFDIAANTTALTRDIGSSITRDDVYEAVKAGFDDAPQMDAFSEQIMDRLHEVMESMQTEFKAVSDEAKQNVAAHGRDTEQVLDATKDGFERLRGDIESYVDRATGVEMKDEIMNNIRENFDSLRAEIDALVSKESNTSLDTIQVELDALRETMTTSLVPGNKDVEMKDEILSNIRENFDTLHTEIDLLMSRDSATSLESVRVELESLRETMTTSLVPGNKDVGMKDEILSNIRENFDTLHTEIDLMMSRDSGASLDTIRVELESLRESMTTSLIPGSPDTTEMKDELLTYMRENFDSLRTELDILMSREPNSSLDTIRAELEGLRENMSTSLVPESTGTAEMKDELLTYMRENFDSLRTELDILMSRESNSSLDTIRTELESLRESMTTSLVPGSTGGDKDEILDALKQGLDSIRLGIERPRSDSSESVLSGTGEILDALHDGLDNLRTEVEKIVNKPVDMTVNYEILDTLKLGLEGVRADIDRLRETGHGEQAVAEIGDSAIVAAEGLKRNDIENLEVLMTQIRIKVEALETMPPPVPQPIPGSLSRDDLAGVEEMLRNVQESVTGFAEQDRSPNDDMVKKEDVEAIETLLRNTKAKIDEIDPEQSVKKDQVDAIEFLVGETRDSVNGLVTQLEDISKKDDVNIIESLVRDILGGLEDLKDRAVKDSEDAEKVTKTDVEAVESVCLDVKTAIEQMLASDIAALASKDDVKNLGELVKEFKNRIEIHAETNAKSFEERQAETVGVGERVRDVQTFLEEFRDAIKDRLQDGVTSVESLGKLLDNLGETINKNANITDNVKEMFETMKEEFEKSNAGVVGSKLEADEKFQQTWDKFDTKIDEKFNDLMTKYDDAQAASEAATKAAEERDSKVEAALLETKNATDDMKLLNDTLGTTFNESVEKLDQASKTVFNRVDETFTKIEETHLEAKAEHQLTREQVFKTLSAIEGVQSNVTEYNPQLLESIKEVLLIVGQHFEYSKISTAILQEKIAQGPALPEVPLLKDVPEVERYDDTHVQEKLDRIVNHMHTAIPLLKEAPEVEKYDDTHVQEKLDRLVGHMETAIPLIEEILPVEKYDDTNVQQKLDRLVDHMETAIPYDDINVQEKLDRLVDEMETAIPLIKEIPPVEKYDDTNVHEKLDKLVDHIETTIPYDDINVQEKLDKLVEHMETTTPYDDINVQEKLDKLVDHMETAIPYDDMSVQEKLDKLVDHMETAIPLIKEIPPVEKYDDTNVQEKLDMLVDHMHEAGKSFAQLDMLDRIHQKVMQTAAEVSIFVSNQTQRIANDHEDKEKAVEAATIALEKRLAQKELVEASVVNLREEEERLKESVAILKAEQEDLAHQKMRLSADVSSLETALRIRREELHAMESRAEGLERRILEGVIDHSRALLLSKPNKGRDAMSRKRVSSQATSTTGSIMSSATSRTSNTTHSAVSMAMGGNRAMLSVPNTNTVNANGSRRILSLNQITHNIPAGGFKRSHSVKTNGGAGALRKSSWGGSLIKKYGDLNKENLSLKESEEDEENISNDDMSEEGTMRRSSRATMLTTTTGTGTSEDYEGTEYTESITGDEESSEEETELDAENHHMVLYDAGQVA